MEHIKANISEKLKMRLQPITEKGLFNWLAMVLIVMYRELLLSMVLSFSSNIFEIISV